MADYIPSNDAALLAFVNNYIDTIGGVETTFGLTTGQWDALKEFRADFSTKNDLNQAAQLATRVARQNKDLSKRNLVANLRQLTTIAQAYPALSDAQRAALQVTIPDRIPTVVPPVGTHPVLGVDFSMRGEHTISARDSATPTSKAKPPKQAGFALWAKVAEVQPSGISTMEFIGVISTPSHRLVWEESQYGLQVFYVAAWRTPNGVDGPLGDFTNATIAK